MDIVRMRVGQLLRRGWKATLFLVLLAGLAGGVAMASWSIGRKASTVFERFMAYSDPRDLFVSFCPADMTLESMAADLEAALQECLTYISDAEAAVVRQLPGVEAAGSVGYVGFTASLVGAPDRLEPGLAVVQFDDGLEWPEGRPLMIEGRPPDPAAPDEISINEQLAGALGVRVGDELEVDFWSAEETSYAALPGERFSGPQARARVVGIERNFRDLVAGVGSEASAIDEARITVGPGVGTSLTAGGRWGAVLASVSDEASASAALDEQFADQFIIAEALLSADDMEPAAEAIRFEARAAMVLGAITSLAAAVFAGQAASRQARREWRDAPTLQAIGMSTREAAGAALARGAITGLLASIVAAIAAVLLSLLGPFGLAAEAETDHAPVMDWLVLGAGAAVAVIVIAAATTWPVVRQFRRRPAPSTSDALGGARALQRRVPPPAAAGLSMATSGRRAGGLPTGLALTGLILAVTTAIVAVVLSASLHSLTSTPSQFGVSWQVSVSTPIEAPDDEIERLLGFLRTDQRIESAAAIRGTDVEIGDEVAWIQALTPVDGTPTVVQPVVTSGRLPEGIDEIALGSVTMSDQGIALGDEIVMTTVLPPPVTMSMTVVGTTVVNNTTEDNAGRGGVVPAAWIDRYEPTVSANHYVVTLDADEDVQQFSDDLRAAAPGGVVQGPVPQGGIRNVERVRLVPFLLSALVGLLAIASLAHAMVLSVRRHRSQLAILKSIGFRTGQVRAAVAWHATVLVALGIVIGVPLGMVVGRWLWGVVADELGVASGPSTPPLVLALIVLAAVLVANLVAAVPGWLAARTPTAAALRRE